MKKILLIEDDKIVQHVHTLILTKLGFDVDLAETGAAALNFLHNHLSYQTILVDIGLPDMSGFDLIKKIKELLNENKKHIPVLALTGYIGSTEKNICLESGAAEVLYKPILKSTMLEALKRHGCA